MIFIKIIFLDIDGVLNTIDTFEKRKEEFIKTSIWGYRIDFFRIEYLKSIIEKTNAKIVLTSTWRTDFKKENGILIPELFDAIEIVEVFEKYNLEIYDITGIDKDRIRQNEIKDWLNNNKVDTFIIIDDESSDLLDYKDFLIETRNSNKEQIGLCEEHIELAINMLNNKKLVLNKKLINKI